MSIFDQNTPKENSEELLYIEIKDELQSLLDDFDHKKGQKYCEGVYLQDSDRTRLINEVGKVALQFIWRKLGMKIPEYTRQELDKDYNLMELKKK